MSVGKRIYLKREMPDHDIMMQFKAMYHRVRSAVSFLIQ